MHTTSTQAVALDVVGRPALAALTMAVEAAAAPVAAAAATARRAAGPRRRVATTLLHPRRLIGRWLDASGASEALCGTTSPAGERECASKASTPEYRHRRSRTDRVPRTASHPRGRTDTAYRTRGADPRVTSAGYVCRPALRWVPFISLDTGFYRGCPESGGKFYHRLIVLSGECLIVLGGYTSKWQALLTEPNRHCTTCTHTVSALPGHSRL